MPDHMHDKARSKRLIKLDTISDELHPEDQFWVSMVGRRVWLQKGRIASRIPSPIRVEKTIDLVRHMIGTNVSIQIKKVN